MIQTARTIVALLLILLAGGAAACGGSDSPEDAAVAAVEDAYAAAGDGDAAGFCELLSADYRADFEDYYGPCEETTLEELRGAAPGEAIFSDPEVAAIDSYEYEGNDVIEVEIGALDDESVEVIAEGESWKLDDFDVGD